MENETADKAHVPHIVTCCCTMSAPVTAEHTFLISTDVVILYVPHAENKVSPSNNRLEYLTTGRVY